MNKWWKFQKDISNHFWVIQNQPNFTVHLGHQRVTLDNQRCKMPIWLSKVGNEIWLILNYSKAVWDIFLKFSPIVYHMFVLIWWKNFCRCSIPFALNGPFLPKFWTALATVIVGIFFRKKFWWDFRPLSVAYQKEFWISWKKRRFQIFQKPSSPGFLSFLTS